MNPIKIALLILVNFLLQGTILNLFSIMGTIPNTTLLIVISLSLISGKRTGMVVAIVAGLLQDVFYSDVIGISTIALFLIALAIGSLDQKIFKENLFLPFVITIVSTLGYYFIQFLLIYFMGIDISFITLMLEHGIKEIIYNSLLVLFVYRMILKNYKEPTVRFTGTI